jgi:hypothetical protein
MRLPSEPLCLRGADAAAEADAVEAIEEGFAAARAGRERPLSTVIAEKRSRFALPYLPQEEAEIRRAGDLP